jgi:hypothetical protein
MFYNERILNYDESYVYIHNKNSKYSETFVFIVDETFFKEYFFPIDKRIKNVYFYERKTILNIDILNRELIYELIEKKGYELITKLYI